MKRKNVLGIVIASSLFLGACSSVGGQPQYYQDDVFGSVYEPREAFPAFSYIGQPEYYKGDINRVILEPSEVFSPFSYTGRTWFDTNQATLKPEGLSELDDLAQKLIEAKNNGLISEKNKLVVLGHTDSRASSSYNQKLSERRAAAVAKHLTAKGIPASSILAVGKGESRPVASNRTSSGRQQNRRVELHIAGPVIRVVYH